MYACKKPIILSKDNIRSTYVTLDTIHTPLASVMIKGKQAYVEAYRIDGVNVSVCGLKREYAIEQLIYRITGMCCNAYDDMAARACVCLGSQVMCHAWTNRKQNFIILPDSDLLPANLYWLTVFELVYSLKYPQSNNTNKCLVYALNCMLKAGMLTIDDCLSAEEAESPQHKPLYTYSFHEICTHLRGNKLRFPKAVCRYYKIFGKRLKRKYKNDQMPDGRVFHLPKYSNMYDVAEAYADVVCECIKLNPPVLADCIANRRRPKGQFADVRQMKHNMDLTYIYAHLHAHGEPVKDCRIYSNPWAFVRSSIIQNEGDTLTGENRIYLKSEYSAECTIVENSINLMLILFHECAHLYHWRAKSRQNSMSSGKAHVTKDHGATYEHQAHKFALWNLIMCGISIETINSTLANLFNESCAETGFVANYSHQALFRYCRMLSYLKSKYGKLYMPTDLGYIFVDHETGKLYRPRDEIKCLN